jgi:cytochrome b
MIVHKTQSSTANVAAWDLPTRIFHWLLLALIVSAWISVTFAEDINDELLNWHRSNGLAILTLVVWRVLWGFAGSSTAKFKGFVSGPSRVLAYGRGLMAGDAAPFLGHNPVGGVMVIALIGVLILQASFGLFAVDDNDLTGGPLNRLLDESGTKFATRWHHRIFENVLLPLAGLHIGANLFYSLYKREPLIKAMVSGEKPRRDYADEAEADIPQRPLMRALLCLVLAAVIVFGSILALGGRFA